MTFGGNLIQAQNLRDCVGKGRKKSPWDRLLPVLGTSNEEQKDNSLFYLMPSGSLLSEKFHGKKLSKQSFGNTATRGARRDEGLYTILTRDIGLGKGVAGVYANYRSDIHLFRVEEFIAGLVDSYWLADELSFLEGSSDKSLLKQICRKIFKVGSVNLPRLVTWWKAYASWLFNTYSDTRGVELLELDGRNIFRKLSGMSVNRRILNREGDQMLRQQELSHLVSTRQMPYMGSATSKESLEAFSKVTQDDFKVDSSTIVGMGQAARRMGSLCRRIRPGRISKGALHISVTSSGEYGHSIRNGAQAGAVAEAINRCLTHVPEFDSIEETPFGPAIHKRGIPLWKTLFRKETLSTEREFLDRYTLVKGIEDRFTGLDEVLGEQIMYVAWKESYPNPILRAEVVPELGNKARVVTLSEYWLNILQAPLAHLLVEAVKYHPSVFSSFHRQDQAFEAAKGLCKLKVRELRRLSATKVEWFKTASGKYKSNRTHLPDIEEAILSSDLKDATNVQNWELTKVILQSFINGYGLSVRPEYVTLVLGTIGPRIIEFPGMSLPTIVTKTGIMMGEAIAKPSLTLLNLCVEELAFLRYCEAEGHLFTHEPAPYRDWRYVHIGGDDHLVRGPVPYLETVTAIHRACGSHISLDKHGFSTRCVKYCERLLNLENLKYGEPYNQGDYSHSVLVDSVKVRLLTRGQSTMIIKDNKNVAIGKSQQLGGCLEWLPNDDRYWTYDKKDSIRNLFIQRMGALLPKQHINPRAFAAIHLPTIVGGFGLGLKRDLLKWTLASPEPTKWLISQLISGSFEKKDLNIFKKLNSNTASRGIASILEYQQKLIDELYSQCEWQVTLKAKTGIEMQGSLKPLTWWELRQKYPSDNNRRTISEAENDGILSIEEFVKRATRGNLFQELLIGKESLKVFNTNKYVDTYRKVVWPYYEKEVEIRSIDLPLDLTSHDIAKAMNKSQKMYFVDTLATFSVVVADDGKSDSDSGSDYSDSSSHMGDSPWEEEEYTNTMDFQLGDNHMDSFAGYKTEQGTLISVHTRGLPNMTIPPARLGVRL